MDSIVFHADLVFGSVQLVEDRKVEDGKLWLGGHAVHRDKSGVVTKITEPEYHCCITV